MTEYTVEQLVRNHEKAFKADAAGDLQTVIQYHLTGEGGGDWIIDIHDGKCEVTPGVHDNPKMSVTADAGDFKDILLGRANAMNYFMSGKLKLAGDLNLAMKLTSLFKMGG